MDWKNKVVELRSHGKSWTEIVRDMKEDFPDLSDFQLHEKVRNYYRRNIGNKAKSPESHSSKNTSDIIDILKNGISLSELSSTLNISKKSCETILDDIKSQGYNVQRIGEDIKISNIVVPEENKIDRPWNGDKVIRFGLMGDTHINSRYTQLTYLHKLYDVYEKEGINTVYHSGDIDEGEQMRPGHQYECYTQGADEHVKEIVRVYPRRQGITTEFITGNHDASIIKRCGYDIGYPIAQQRDDIKYLGQSNAVINLTPNCILELRHPIDSTAYAISYKTQKMIDSMSGGEKPQILAIGHYHKGEYIFYRNVHSFQTGCVLAQTPWMKGKGIAAHMGGWIIEVHVDGEGTITRIKQEFIPFYKEIKEDYRNWQ